MSFIYLDKKKFYIPIRIESNKRVNFSYALGLSLQHLNKPPPNTPPAADHLSPSKVTSFTVKM